MMKKKLSLPPKIAVKERKKRKVNWLSGQEKKIQMNEGTRGANMFDLVFANKR